MIDQRANASSACDAESIRHRLLERGVRPTTHREAIYRAMKCAGSHPTADELFRAVRKDYAGISLATVYNTLDLFTRTGLCRKLTSAACAVTAPNEKTPRSAKSQGAGVAAIRYDAEVHDHAHFVTNEGRIIDLPTEISGRFLSTVSDELIRMIERHTGRSVGRISIEVFETPPNVVDVGTRGTAVPRD